MDINSYAQCFVRTRISGGIIQKVFEATGVASSTMDGTLTTTEAMYNFTEHEVRIVHADGRTYVIPPANADNVCAGHLRSLYAEYQGCFVIVKTFNRYVEMPQSKLMVRDTQGREFDYHEHEQYIAKNPQNNFGAPNGVLKAIPSNILHRQAGGVTIPSMCVTVGFSMANRKVENKIAMLFPNRGGGAPAAGLRLVANISNSTIKQLFIVMGTHVYPVRPTYNEDSPDVIHFFRTNSSGVEEMLDPIPLDEILNSDNTELSAYETRKEAEQHIAKLKEAKDNYDKLRDENKQQADKIEELNKKAKRLEDELKAEKNATKQAKVNNTTTKWNKAAAIIVAAFSVITSAIAFGMKFL